MNLTRGLRTIGTGTELILASLFGVGFVGTIIVLSLWWMSEHQALSASIFGAAGVYGIVHLASRELSKEKLAEVVKGIGAVGGILLFLTFLSAVRLPDPLGARHPQNIPTPEFLIWLGWWLLGDAVLLGIALVGLYYKATAAKETL